MTVTMLMRPIKESCKKKKGVLLLNFEDYGENRHNEDEDGEDDCDAKKVSAISSCGSLRYAGPR